MQGANILRKNTENKVKLKRNNNEKSMSPTLLRELYESALAYRAEELEEMEKYMRQYEGSPEIDGSAEEASTVRNVTFEIIECEVSESLPYPKVEPSSYSDKRDECSRVIERLCRTVLDRLPFEAMNDADERYTYIYGGSVWYVEWDSRAYGGRGGIKVYCLSPDALIGQPGVTEISDMDYCFLRLSTTKGELVRRYGVSPAQVGRADSDTARDGVSSVFDTVNLVVAFYRGDDGAIGKLVFSGELILEDMPNYYQRKGEICSLCLSPIGECECGGEAVMGDLIYEKVTIGKEELCVPYYTPRRFPIVVRRNTLSDGSLLGSSDCKRIRPQQQAINKLESRILSKLIRSGVTPVIPDGATVSVTNSVFGQIIRLRPGERADSYGKIDTTPDVSSDIVAADRLYDQAKRIIGISDAYQGADSASQDSGYARRLKISQSGGRLELKKRLKELAYSEIYRLIFEHYLAFADEGVSLNSKDTFGDVHNYSFSRYDFIEDDGRGGYEYNGRYLFSVDLNDGTEYGRETLWERNLANLQSGTLGDPASPDTLLRYWQSQERAHYPYARENVEHFKLLVLEAKTKNKESEKV
jgi:hypothetical protein